MSSVERLIFEYLNSVYGNAEFEDGFIYVADEDNGNAYKVAVYTTA